MRGTYLRGRVSIWAGRRGTLEIRLDAAEAASAHWPGPDQGLAQRRRAYSMTRLRLLLARRLPVGLSIRVRVMIESGGSVRSRGPGLPAA